jgi:hypothetical protein
MTDKSSLRKEKKGGGGMYYVGVSQTDLSLSLMTISEPYKLYKGR